MKINCPLVNALCSLSLIFLVTVTVSGEFHPPGTKRPIPKVFDFGNYVETFKKNYGPLETLHRAKLFFGRTLKIFQHNVLYTQRKVAYFLTQNYFTDMTASEFRHIHTNKEHELAPVKEALANPDLPANRLSSVRKLKGEPDDGFSQASLEDLSNNAKFDAEKHKVKPILTFMDNQNVDDMKMVLVEIEDMSGEAINKMAELIDMKGSGAVQVGDDGIIAHQQIKFKPVIKSDNKRYEPQVIMSQGADSQSKMGTNYAKFLMSDPNFELNLNPYPPQAPPAKRRRTMEEPKDESNSKPTSFFGKFINSFKKATERWLKDEFEEPEAKQVAPVEQKKPGRAEPEVKFNIDWRITGCVSPIQDQNAQCDSCYAFSVLSLMEYFHCRQTGQMTPFSAQYIVDCGGKANLNGCRSSKVSNVGLFIKNYGLELNSKYPYNAQENSCPYNFDDPAETAKSGYLRPRISHWQNFPDMVAWYKWLPKSPLIVGINMPGDFLGYGGGVHDGLDCVNDMTHAMLLVGSGLEDGREFWLLKNSFSESWGETGYFKLAKSAPLRCFNSAIVARAKFLEIPA